MVRDGGGLVLRANEGLQGTSSLALLSSDLQHDMFNVLFAHGLA